MKKIIYALYIGALLGASSCADLDINPASSIDKKPVLQYGGGC